jgi:hypothetical protein
LIRAGDVSKNFKYNIIKLFEEAGKISGFKVVKVNLLEG